MRAGHAFAGTRLLVERLAFGAQKISIKHVVNERRFAGTRDAGDTGEDADWKMDIDILQIVLARAGDLDRRCRSSPRFRNWNRFTAAEIIARERLVDRPLRGRC